MTKRHSGVFLSDILWGSMIFLFSLLMRAFLSLYSSGIAADSVWYILQGMWWFFGGSITSLYYPPMFPFMGAILSRTTGMGIVHAFQWTTVFCGAGIVLCLYFVAFLLRGRLHARMVGVLASLYPVLCIKSVYLFSETPFSFFI